MSPRNEQWTQFEPGGVAPWLIHHAACRTPEELSSRLEEEWLADLESRTSALSRLRFAIGCCWATVVIIHDYPRNEVAAALSAPPSRGLITLADGSFGYVSLRSGTLFLIVGLFAVLFCALTTTISHTPGLSKPSNSQSRVLGSEQAEMEMTYLLPGR